VPPLDDVVYEGEESREGGKTCKGIHWPIPQWEAEFERKHDPEKEYVYRGVVGIVMEPKYGWAIGCSEMFDEHVRIAGRKKDRRD
jgi:hypothetical protein